MSGNGCGQDKKKKDGAPKGAPSLEKSELLPGLVTTVAAIAATTETTAIATAAAAAATAAETTAAAAATAAAAEAAGARFLRTGFVDSQGATAEIGAIQLLSRGLRLFSGAHGDEREATWATGHFVHGDVNVGDGTELAKGLTELVFGGLERHIADVQFRVTHVMFFVDPPSAASSVPTVGFEIIT